MVRLFLVALSLLAVCQQPVPADNPAEGPGAEATTPASAASWADRFALVRADLDQLEAAYGVKDKDAVLASWEQAYRQRFEPLIERPAAGRVDPHLLLAVEYAFGRLKDRVESPRDAPAQAALVHLREQLDLLEAAVVSLPTPG